MVSSLNRVGDHTIFNYFLLLNAACVCDASKQIDKNASSEFEL
jgi:hypothetical protein